MFPEIGRAWCVPICCITGDPTCTSPIVPVNECNAGVTPSCWGCGWWYNVSCNDVGYICKSGTCFDMLEGNNWTKCDKFPDTSDYNGRPCAVYSSGILVCNKNGEGVQDASERKCVQCNENLYESKICGSAGTKSTETCKDSNGDGIPDDNDGDGIPDYCISLGCGENGNGKCESACDPNNTSLKKCDDKTPASESNPGDPCGYNNTGTCDANCQCIGEVSPPQCSDGIDNDSDGFCDLPTSVCTDGSTPGDPQCTDANDNDESDGGCNCPDCSPELQGGLVPCGRMCDDPNTDICECDPCTLCHLFVLFKRIVDFLAKDVLFPLAVLIIVIGGVMFLTAAGSPERINAAKKILTSTVIGLAIIFLSWLIVNTIIGVLVRTDNPFGMVLRNWSEIPCPICGDGVCESKYGETSENCPADCGAPAGCGNGTCDVAGGECATCPADCNLAACCGNGTCDAAVGETNANCPADCAAPAECPNGACNVAGGECATCPADCNLAACCGNGTCDAAVGETNANCPADCPSPAGCFCGVCGQ